MPYGDLYTVRHSATVTTAITILQLKGGATAPFEVLRAWCNQKTSTTSNSTRIQLLRKSAAATVTTGAIGTHVFKVPGAPDPSLALGTTSTGVIASAEGTDGDVIRDDGFNDLSGWEWVRPAVGFLFVPAGGFIALKFADAPTNNSQVWKFGMDIMELGN